MKSEVANAETLLDEKSASEFLKVSKRTMQGHRFKGSGPKFVRLSARCVRYRKQDLIDWINQNIAVSTSALPATKLGKLGGV